MRKVIAFTILTLFFLPMSSYAKNSNWSISESSDKKGYVLSNGDKAKLVLETTNVKPKITKIQKVNDHITIVYFHSTTTGTFVMFDEISGAVFNTITNKVLGVYPYYYRLISDTPKNEAPDQAIWKIDKSKIVIIEKDLGLNKTIKID